ncbi:hypothetical protein PE067_11920 [Paracoccus sp. DMF-8]|nr:hypothetical protein [Paracoccus sp. DMF-8]MDF3606772.1 hypothetical protein [Paracoccus sp. DMF-8]
MNLRLSAFPLRPERVHEACGPMAIGFAVIAAAQAGHILWVRDSWRPEMIAPSGLSPWLDPARITIALTADQTETLAVAEEGLRDGAVDLVVLELTAPVGLTAGRRLQLAAQAGHTTGLCLIPEGMGSPAAETRWRCAAISDPDPTEDSTLQNWQLIKNKSGTIGSWHVRWSRAARRLTVVSRAGE